MANTRHDTKSYDTLTNQDTNPFAADQGNAKRSPTIDEEETPQSSGLVIHVVPETNKGEYGVLVDGKPFQRNAQVLQETQSISQRLRAASRKC